MRISIRSGLAIADAATAVGAVPRQAAAGRLAALGNVPRRLHSRTLATLFAVGGVCVVMLCCVGSAGAVGVPGPRLVVHTEAFQGEFPEGVAHDYQVNVVNTGSEAASGPVVVKDRLPVGFAVSVGEWNLVPAVRNGLVKGQGVENIPIELLEGKCEQAGGGAEAVTLTCIFEEALAPDAALELNLSVTASAGAGSAANVASASAPGAAEASVSEPLVVGAAALPFGPRDLMSYIAGVDGEPDRQAGDHPYEMTTRIDLNSIERKAPEGGHPTVISTEDVKDVVDDLPPGLIGDAQATPKCTLPELSTLRHCALDTRVGQIRTGPPHEETGLANGIFNMVPEHGVAAEFGFYDGLGATHVIYASVAPTPAGYVVRATSPETPQISLTDVIATFFGDPATKDNNQDAKPHIPFFTNPSDCSSNQPRVSTVHLDSWQRPGAFNNNGTPEGEPLVESPNWFSTSSDPAESPPVTGCELLRFEPSLSAQPDTTAADSPTGLTVDEQLPQQESFSALATPPLRDEVVTLPAGMAISPSAADGLVGCQESGPEGMNFDSPSVGDCPAASKVGTIEVTTALLEEPLTEGGVFVAQPKCGGPGQPACTEELAETGGLFALYLEVSNANRGIHIKLKGKVEVGGNGQYSREHGLAPGQIRTSVLESPQIGVFSDLKLRLNNGPRAPLATPQSCGTFTTNAVLTPWSAPESGPPAVVQPSFGIAGCEGRFAPAFNAGTVKREAGTYSPFSVTFSRQDREQDLAGVTVNMPPGLLGKIAGIAQCPEAQANAGTCPAASKIGTATASAGSGSHPFWQSGPVYLTGPYNGGPFGLSVVVPAKAGPYNLGNIVVRASIRINPSTAAATVVSNPLPQSIDGVPLRVQTVNVTVGQEDNFTFNATNCTPSSVNATLTGTQGATAGVSSAYQPAGCAGMKFAPGFSASTSGRASKASGASLDVKVSYPPGPAGTYANIAKTKVDLPKQLPSRLTTLNKACLAATFEANPANCPSASDVGTATATTPLLNVPVSGPAYLVSHGGEAFPDLDIVLQGEGVTILLVGNTNIKKGITSSTFNAIPDAPVSSFELKLPTGKFSILGSNVPQAAKFSLCGQKLTMPTTITGQNGAVIKQTTKIAVTGCPKVKKAKAAKRGKAKRAGNHRGTKS